MLDKVRKVKNKIANMSVPVKASLAFIICTIMQRGISVLTTPIFTRLLTTEQYGYFSIFNSWLDVVSVFTTLKLAGGVFTQALVKFDKEREELTASTAGLGTTLSLIVTIIYIPLRNIINPLIGMDTLIVICMILASWATLMFELWASRQRVEYNYKPLVALTLFTSVAKPLFGIIAVLATQEYKAQARIISLVLVEVVAYTGLFVMFIKKGRTFFNRRFWKYSLSLNVPLIPHYLTRTILNQCDRLMINAMLGYSSAGIYSLAYNLATMLSLVTTSILNAFNPWMYKRIKKEEYNRIGTMSYALLEAVAFVALGLISIAPELIKIFAPAEYYEAIWVIPPVTAGIYFLFMYSLFANFEFYFEKTKFMAVVSTVGGLLNVVLNYLCIPIFGYVAAGYTTLFCYMIYAIAHYLGMRRIIKTELANVRIYDMKIIVGISLLFLVLSLILMLFYEAPIVRYSLIIIVLIIVFIKREKVIGLFKEMKKE